MLVASNSTDEYARGHSAAPLRSNKWHPFVYTELTFDESIVVGIVYTSWREGCDLVVAVARHAGDASRQMEVFLEWVRYEGYF